MYIYQSVHYLEVNVARIIDLLQQYQELYNIVVDTKVSSMTFLIDGPILSLNAETSKETKAAVLKLINFAVHHTVDGQTRTVQYTGVV